MGQLCDTTVTHSLLFLSVAAKQRCETKRWEGKVSYFSYWDNNSFHDSISSKTYPGIEKRYMEGISPDEARHRWSLKSACCAYSTSERT